jgi:hypothetical protein
MATGVNRHFLDWHACIEPPGRHAGDNGEKNYWDFSGVRSGLPDILDTATSQLEMVLPFGRRTDLDQGNP